ncbi:hypothetical protein BD413DRAFT_597280 [Trametes elegans]|nr:hypothetical protein BD413DRAFT_599966 [Trametes elegans]KAI0759454.1 hypothetical protein BD413DRAFT_597280 [Trametes elegans]
MSKHDMTLARIGSSMAIHARCGVGFARHRHGRGLLWRALRRETHRLGWRAHTDIHWAISSPCDGR